MQMHNSLKLDMLPVIQKVWLMLQINYMLRFCDGWFVLLGIFEKLEIPQLF